MERKKKYTKLIWIEVYTFKDTLNNHPFAELAEFAISMLILHTQMLMWSGLQVKCH